MFDNECTTGYRLNAVAGEYDLGEYATMTAEQIDQEVIAEARRLTHEQPDHLWRGGFGSCHGPGI